MRALKFITGHVTYNPAYTYKFQLNTTIVLAGVFLNMIICGLLFRDLEWTKTLRVNKKIVKRKSKSSEQLKTGSLSSVSSPSRYIFFSLKTELNGAWNQIF